mmetsp:Transcript_46837/g.87227  ORF Transcript_46837/g.87227 Transcript_46837/m.87227 type:complete len:138 (+) Transcript_46837:3475-3888(+)
MFSHWSLSCSVFQRLLMASRFHPFNLVFAFNKSSTLFWLTFRYLGKNHLTGAIPSELSSLTNLTDLILFMNQLTGRIPSELAALSRLKHLQLNQNQLSGTIPVQFAALTNIHHMYVDTPSNCDWVSRNLLNILKLAG